VQRDLAHNLNQDLSRIRGIMTVIGVGAHGKLDVTSYNDVVSRHERLDISIIDRMSVLDDMETKRNQLKVIYLYLYNR